MILVNGIETDLISVHDRGLAFGDGVFETLAVVDGEILNWERHCERLALGCTRLRLDFPHAAELNEEVQVVARGHPRSVVKIIVTRGNGGRGYTPSAATTPSRVVLRRAWPNDYAQRANDGIRVCVASHRLSHNPALAGLKHLNRLDQVLASVELDALQVDEALMLDYEGRVVEATRCNLFAIYGNRLATPLLDGCGVLGIMRSLIIERAPQVGLRVDETRLTVADLCRADELFLCNAIAGIWPVVEMIGTDPARFDIGDYTRVLQRHQSH